jgi:type II secretory pathway component PulF
LGLLFSFLIPQIRSFIGDNANFSFTQRILFFVSDLVQKIGETEIMVGVIGISLFFFFRKRKAETLETKYDAVLWLSGLSLLLKSGITTKQSFVFSEQIILNSPLKKHIHGLIEQVLKGVSLPHLLAQTPGLPKSAAKFAEIGESCGALGDLLEQCSQIEIQTLLAQTKRRLALLQPALLLSIGFILVVILASLFPALYDGAFSSLQGAYGP